MGFNTQGAGAQTRAGFVTNKASGGGAGPTLTALLQVGPDYGENAVGEDSDDNTHTVGITQEERFDLEMEADPGVGVAADLDQLEFDGDPGIGAGVDFWQAVYTGSRGVGLASGRNTADLFTTPERNHVVSIPYMHYSMNPGLTGGTSVQVGFINPRQDAGGTAFWAAAQRSGSYVQSGSPFGLRPETVDGVTEDERLVYCKWPLNQFGLTTQDAPLGMRLVLVGAEFTNPSAVLDANISCNLRVGTNDPWGNTFDTEWDQVEPLLSQYGASLGTKTQSLPANATNQFLGFQFDGIQTNVAGKWVVARFSSDLVGQIVTVKHANDSGSPLVPGDFTAQAPQLFDWRFRLDGST